MTVTATDAITRVIHVNATPETAFRVFTEQIGDWWPLEHYSVLEGVQTVVFENDRIVERAADGSESVWGEILDFEVAGRLRFSWHPGRDDDDPTEVEVTFAADGGRHRGHARALGLGTALGRAQGRARRLRERVAGRARPFQAGRRGGLTEEIAPFGNHEVVGTAGARDLEPTHDCSRNPVGLPHHQLGGAGDLVADRDHRRMQLVADPVTRAAQIAQHFDACCTERNVDRALPPRAAERVGDQHADRLAGELAEALAKLRSGGIRIDGAAAPACPARARSTCRPRPMRR